MFEGVPRRKKKVGIDTTDISRKTLVKDEI